MNFIFYFLSLKSVRKFFLRNGIDVTEEEVRSAFKRLDVDRDARVTFNEFKRIFSESMGASTGFKSSGSSLQDSRISSKGFSNSPLKSQTQPIRSPQASPLRTTLRSPVRTSSQRFYSPNRYTSPLRDRTMSVLEMSNDRINRSLVRSPEPLRNTSNLLNSSISSGMRGSRGMSGSNNFGSNSFNETNNLRSSNYVTFEEENFISYIKELLDLENQLEKAKCDNIIKSDFNGEDAFSIFEVDRRGYLTDLDIKYGLNSLDIYPTQEEIALLVKRYESRGEGVLT